MLYSVSCTTRPPRQGEIEGVQYYFLDMAEFRRMIEQGRFLEWKEVHGNLYGTPVEPVNQALQSGRRMILDIDVEGAKEIFRKIPDAVGIFITAPNLGILEERLRLRGTDSDQSIRTRLGNAAKEMESAPIFRYQILNDDLERAADELAAIIRKEWAANN
jgi:guanylate kinase